MTASKSIFILLGSNMNNPKLQLKKARKLIVKHLSKIICTSSIYKTAPWGKDDQPAFYNQVLKLRSGRPAVTVLKIIKEIEQVMGRVFYEQWGPRIIDIDILSYGQEVVRSKPLTIPHTQISNRLFTLIPLQEVSPRWRHPVSGKSIAYLVRECKDQLSVIKEK